MYSYMQSYYFSVYFGYNMLCGRRSSNAQKLTFMYLKVFKLYLFTQFNAFHSFILIHLFSHAVQQTIWKL